MRYKDFFDVTGTIKYDNFDESIINNFDKQSDLLVEDMLHIEYLDNISMDIGWYEGVEAFMIFVIQDSNWQFPIEKRICKDIYSLAINIKECDSNIQRLHKVQ